MSFINFKFRIMTSQFYLTGHVIFIYILYTLSMLRMLYSVHRYKPSCRVLLSRVTAAGLRNLQFESNINVIGVRVVVAMPDEKGASFVGIFCEGRLRYRSRSTITAIIEA